MSEIKKLIERLCPDGVEYKKLGDIADITIGEFVHKNKQNPNGKYPVYNGGSSFTGYYDNYNRTGNKIVVSARGAYAGFVNKVYGCYWAGNSSYSIDIISPEVSWHFVYYYLKLKQTFMISKQQKGGGVPAISKKQMQDFEIPVPPIEVQSKIVEILDNFTELEAELEAELKARRKQYEYYRNQLLTFDEAEGARFDVKWMKLGEICDKVEKIKWNLVDKDLQFIYVDLSSVDISTHIISSDNVIDNSNAPSRAQQIVKTNDILFGTTRPTLMRYCMIPNALDGQICSTGYCVIRANKNFVLARWLFYMISSQTFFEYVNERQQGAGYPSISDKQVFLFEVPIPPLEEQERIVSILDRFEALTTDLQSGLPAEIAARRKQYEYYREQLLTFKRKTA